MSWSSPASSTHSLDSSGVTGSTIKQIPWPCITQLKQTFNLIDSNYPQPLTLADLAKAANLSPNYFCRFFQKITHHSPIDYLNRYRVEMACLKLAHTNDSITNIALACGFNDVSYFIKLFHRYKETSPLKYRQLIKSHSK